jgi:hypothetical protein
MTTTYTNFDINIMIWAVYTTKQKKNFYVSITNALNVELHHIVEPFSVHDFVCGIMNYQRWSNTMDG